MKTIYSAKKMEIHEKLEDLMYVKYLNVCWAFFYLNFDLSSERAYTYVVVFLWLK